MTSGGILPFRVSTDFNLGLFLKNEKSALKLVGNKTGDSTSGAGDSPGGGQTRFKQVDDYVTHEYWSLDIEFLLSCLVPILWSITGIYLLGVILPKPCFELNTALLDASIFTFVVNIATEFIVIIGLVFAKYCESWQIKINLLNGAIGTKLILTMTNFIIAVFCCSTHSCGATYSNQLHEYDDEMVRLEERNAEMAIVEQISGNHSEAIINGFRYYDTKITGLNQIFASIGQCAAVMILLVKRNDIKMYVLWRLAKLDEYIDDMHSHM